MINAKRFLTTLVAAVALLLTACMNPMSELSELPSGQQTLETSGETATLDLAVYVPSYREPAADRDSSTMILDPGTEYLRLFLNGIRHGEDIVFGTPQPSADGPVLNLQIAVPVPLSGAYESVGIKLIAADGTTVLTAGQTRGPDGTGIEITPGGLTAIAVGCFPVTSTALSFDATTGEAVTSGSLAAGETAYFTFSGTARVTYDFVADAGTTTGDVDLFLFDETGKPIMSGETIGEQIEAFTHMTVTAQKYYVMAYALTDMASATLTVTETNQSPVAVSGQDVVVTAGATVSFDGSASYDPEGANILREWTIADSTGTTVAGPLYGSIISHTFNTTGDYTVNLSVRDEVGGIGTSITNAYVTEANVAPVAVVPASVTAKEQDDVVLDGSGSYDPNTGDTLSYVWTVTDDLGAVQATYGTAQPTHTFMTPGTYYAELVVTDDATAPLPSSPSTIEITIVSNRAPTAVAAALPTVVAVGDAITLDATGSFDSDDDFADLTFSWQVIDSAGTADTPTAGATSSYTFTTPGTYDVELTVADPIGGTDVLVQQVAVESVFRFDVQFAAGIDVSEFRPVIVMIARVDQLTDTANVDNNDYFEKKAEAYVTAPGEAVISTLDIPEYSTANTYIAVVIHDVNNNYSPAGLIAQAMGDQQDFIGIYQSGVTGGLVYDWTPPLPTTDVALAPDTVYSVTMDNQTGDLSLIVY